jgi:hypothetical protein
MGFKKTGCRRRNVNKEDLVAEDKPRLVSSLGPVVGNGYRRDLWFPLLGEPGFKWL